MRLKLPRWTTLLLAASLALNAAFAILMVKLHRWDAELAFLRKETEGRVRVEWRLSDGSKKFELPTMYEVARGAHPIEVIVDHDFSDADIPTVKQLAQVFAKHGTLEHMHFMAGDARPIEAWMEHLGSQPRLEYFISYYGSFTDDAGTLLARYPQITLLSINSLKFSGEKFPHMPKLTAADLGYCSITPAGLQRVAACPTLKKLKVNEPEEGSIPLRDAYFALKKARQDLELRGIE